MVKFMYYFGLAVFIIGIILLFIRHFKPELFASIDDFHIDIIWPIGMIIYSIALIFIGADKKKKDAN